MKTRLVTILGLVAGLGVGSLVAEPAGAFGPPVIAKNRTQFTKVKKTIKLPAGLRFGARVAGAADQLTEYLRRVYGPELVKLRGGPRAAELEHMIEQRVAGLRKAIAFNDNPVGSLDGSFLAGEFSYGNKESLTRVKLTQKVRVKSSSGSRVVSRSYQANLFFFGDPGQERLWKVYQVHNKKGLFGGKYQRAVAYFKKKFGAAPSVLKADPEAKRDYEWSQWSDGSTILRLVDLSEHGQFGLVHVELATYNNLDRLRTYQPVQEDEVDEDVRRATGG